MAKSKGNGKTNGNGNHEPKPLGVQYWITLAFGIVVTTALLFANGRNGQQMLSSVSFIPSGILPVWLPILGIVALMMINAALVASETAIGLLRPAHVKHLKETNEKRAIRLQKLLDDEQRCVAACSLGVHLTRFLIAIVVLFFLSPEVLALFVQRFAWADSWENLFWTCLILMVPVGGIHLIFGELLPKSYASLHPHRLAAILFPGVWIAKALLAPVAMVLTGIAGLLTSRFGGKASFSIPNAAEEEILTLVETAEEQGEIVSEERELLRSVFDFTDTVAREIMTPRVDVDALPVKSDPTEVVKLVQESGHSRIPLYEDSDDQIVGIIHAKDLLLAMLNGKAPNLRTLMRPALFVPENKNLYELITEMRQHRTQMAIVQDEFGGTAGIVTIEDIVEELVGEIIDEYDVEDPDIVPDEDGWIVKGKTHVDDVSEAIGTELPSDEFDTIGGLVFGLFGRQPKPKEEIDLNGVRFCVAETDGRRISKVRVRVLQVALDLESSAASQD